MKTLCIGIAIWAAAPGLAQAMTVYTYDLATGDVEAESYEPTAIERRAAEVKEAVVSIDGYKNVPVYVLERRQGETGEAVVARKQVGTTERRVSAGSGFFITADGYILTNKHVVDDAAAAYVVDTGSKEVYARVIYKDDEHDIALIKVVGDGYPTVAIGDDPIEVGDEVASVGNALGRFVDSVSSGRIISLDETVLARDGGSVEELHGLIVTDARLYPGDSGGPLLDEEGRAIGVNVAIIAGTDVSFSIPVGAVREAVRRAGLSY